MASANERELADLKSRLGSLQSEAAPLRKALSQLESQIAKTANDMQRVERVIAKANEKPRISDHAVIRYLERRHNFDFEGVRKSLLTDNVVSAVRMGAQGVKIEGGSLKIANNCVTTFIPKGVR